MSGGERFCLLPKYEELWTHNTELFSSDPYWGSSLVFLPIGHDSYRDGQQMHDGSSPAGRERSSSLQGMDMASLPPRKRPWQDGPGTGDPRERESPGGDGGENPGGKTWNSLL